MHNNQVVLDTMLYKDSDEAKIIIEKLVQQFSNEPISIDSKITHGLYVFNIENHNWKSPDKPFRNSEELKSNADCSKKQEYRADKKPTYQDISNNSETDFDDINIDSLFREFSLELSTNWEQARIDIAIDSIGESVREVWSEFKKMDFQQDPDIQNLKKDINKFLDKIKATQIIIIQDGDTLDFD